MNSLGKTWDTIKGIIIYVLGVPEGEERGKKEQKKIYLKNNG